MSKHTLGPWTVETETKNKFCPDTGAPIVWKFHYVHAPQEKYLLGLSDRGSAEGNARLIAAAPEMLEALKLIYHAYTYGTCDVDAMEEVVSKAHAAIAKAEGRGE